jgi:hypothetical protein
MIHMVYKTIDREVHVIYDILELIYMINPRDSYRHVVYL